MKKISLIILLLAVVAGLVGPHFAGNSFNQQLDEFAAKISEQPFYEASIESREQSWFSTTASLVISLDGAAFGPQADDVEQPKLSLTIPIEAQHGPLLTQSGLGLGWIDWQVNIAIDDPEARFALPEGEEYIYSATGIVNLFGTVSYQDVMPAFTYTHPELALTVAISGWQGNASLTSDSIDSATEEAMSVALSFQSTQIATIENISIVTDLEAGLMQAWKNSLYDGVASFTIDGMTIANPTTGEETKLKNIVMDSVTSVDQTAGLGDVLERFRTPARDVLSALVRQDGTPQARRVLGHALQHPIRGVPCARGGVLSHGKEVADGVCHGVDHWPAGLLKGLLRWQLFSGHGSPLDGARENTPDCGLAVVVLGV